ncbi:hypothetical protein [Winogradskya humida]|uniref:Saccharopine dehydrogenase n=1 Tax=Winogradskya humida TaxID=113566 RepID=A0ABQ4A1F0_9ACTN|nr:hypothetical protein [Actinoplanes humidus]GIE24671.1 saccharopine dehydrogenase [Actinoplanes humidus]
MKIAVYGAAGYQGRLVLAELARRAITAVPLGRADAAATDHAALTEAFTGSDGVVNCAGPFLISGLGPLRAALDAGIPYVDTAGEQAYLRDTYALSGMGPAVPAATDAGVPTDLLAHLIADRWGPLADIAVTHDIVGGGGASRGSLRSLAGIRWRPRAEGDTGFPLTEVLTIPRHVQVGRVEGFVSTALAAGFGTPLAAGLIESLPEGPGEEDRRLQRFRYVVDARTLDNREVQGVVEGRDTYGTTAVIAVETLLRLTATERTGVAAPGEVLDAAEFLGALRAYGIVHQVTGSS